VSDDDLAGIEVRSGVNDDGEAFCTVVAKTKGGRMLLGQLEPSELRALALQWLETAEAAEQDAALLRCCRKLELPDEFAGAVMTELRNSRGGS
jgi:hypothetical protein